MFNNVVRVLIAAGLIAFNAAIFAILFVELKDLFKR